MDRYLEGEEIAEDVLVADLEKAVARASFHPVVPVCSVTGVGCTELLDLMVRAFPSPLEHTPPEVFTPAGAVAPAIALRPRRPAGGRGGAHDQRPVRRPAVGGARLQRDPGPRRHRARVGPLLVVLRRGRRPRRPRRGREDRRARPSRSAGTSPRQPGSWPGTSAASVGSPARRPATRSPPSTTRGCSGRGRCPSRCCPVAIVARSKADDDKLATALSRLAAEDPSIRIENNPETHQLVLWCMGETHAAVVLERLGRAVLRARRPGAVPGVPAGDLRRPGEGPRAAREAVRRARAVRRVRHRGRAAPGGRWVRVRRQGGRRRRAAQLHPVGGEGRPEPDGARGAGRLPGRRPAGHPHRRQGPRRGLLRHGLPDGRRAGAARGRDLVVGHPAGALRRGDGGRSPTTWSAG